MSKTLNTLKTTVLGTKSMNSVVKFINHNKIIYVFKNLKQLRCPSKVISCTNCAQSTEYCYSVTKHILLARVFQQLCWIKTVNPKNVQTL